MDLVLAGDVVGVQVGAVDGAGDMDLAVVEAGVGVGVMPIHTMSIHITMAVEDTGMVGDEMLSTCQMS